MCQLLQDEEESSESDDEDDDDDDDTSHSSGMPPWHTLTNSSVILPSMLYRAAHGSLIFSNVTLVQ